METRKRGLALLTLGALCAALLSAVIASPASADESATPSAAPSGAAEDVAADPDPAAGEPEAVAPEAEPVAPEPVPPAPEPVPPAPDPVPPAPEPDPAPPAQEPAAPEPDQAAPEAEPPSPDPATEAATAGPSSPPPPGDDGSADRADDLAAPEPREQVCPDLDTGHIIPGGSQESILITAPEGMLISAYCVKAGSAQQGDGPEYHVVDPPRASVEISHSSGKDISHYAVTYVAAEPGTVTVTKKVAGTADGYAWEFDVSLDGDVRTVSDEAPTAEWSGLEPGAYTLSEPNLPDGWTTGGFSCDAPDTDQGEPGYQIEVTSGLNVVCALTNTAEAGSVTVVKSAVGGDGSFDFVLQPLDDSGDPMTGTATTSGGTGSATFPALPGGTAYALEEADADRR